MKIKSFSAILLGKVITILFLLSCSLLTHAQTPTRDADNPARQPFRVSIPRTTRTVGTAIKIAPIFQVPSGKRLVIEQITFRALAPTNGIVSGVHAAIETTIGGKSATHWLPVVRQLDQFVVNQQMRVYADPETELFFDLDIASKTLGLSMTFESVAISGYFIDLD